MFFLHLVAKRHGRRGRESGSIHVYKIPDSDCMGKHFSGAEHTAELLWIFGSSFCCPLCGEYLAGTIAGKLTKNSLMLTRS